MRRLINPQSVYFLLLVSVFTLFSTGCQKITSPTDFVNPGPQFDMDLFEANLIDAIDGDVVGYSYSIGLNGNAAREGAGGLAVIGGSLRGHHLDVSMTPYLRMHIASISKPITAMALFKAMEEVDPGMDLNEEFAAYLPPHWNVHSTLSDVTFMDLLEHRSGILTEGETYGSLKDIVEAGVSVSDKGNYSYNNVNFSLFRIIIPYLLQGPNLGAGSQLVMDDIIDQVTQSVFKSWVTEQILEPANIDYDAWNAHPATPVLHYDCSDMDKEAWLTGNYEHRAGAYGLYLSANGVASVYAHARYANSFLSEKYRDWLFEDGYSWGMSNGEHGTYFSHSGGWRSNGRGYRGYIIAFPNNVEATVMVNCRNSDASENLASKVRQAYDGAWETP